MMISLAIKTAVTGIRSVMSSYAQWLELPRIQDHYHQDVDGFYGRFSQVHKSRIASEPWISYYFYRTSSLQVESSRLVFTNWKRPSTGQYYKVPTIPYALTELNFSLVSNNAYLLENLEEFFYLRVFPLTGNYLVEFDQDLATLGPISVSYTFPEISTQYRVSPTEYGSLASQEMTLSVRHPLFYIPPEAAREIRQITFSIYDNNGPEPVLLERSVIL